MALAALLAVALTGCRTWEIESPTGWRGSGRALFQGSDVEIEATTGTLRLRYRSASEMDALAPLVEAAVRGAR